MFWLAVPAIAAVIFAALYFRDRQNLKRAVQELREINASGSSRRLRISMPGREMEALAREVNRALDEKQLSEIAHRRVEKERRDEIANISHDLRTPLTSVLGYLQLAKAADCVPEERQEYLQIAESRAKALQNLLTGFYDLSRLGADGYPLEMEAVRPGEVLCQLAADYYGDFMAAGMEPRLELPENLPAVWADRGGLSRVFGNLMQNAVKHGGDTLWICGEQQGDILEISFRNAAPGLTLEDCRQLFDRFFTADRMRTGKNTGLGLAIVKALCEKMEGTVSADLSGGMLTISTRWKVYPQRK